MVSVKELSEQGTKLLQQSSEIPNKEARILLAHLLKQDMMWLITHDSDGVECEEEYFELVKRRVEHEPIEYITNQASFYGEDFYVDSRVLIPRPETEILVDKVVATCKDIKKPKIVEIGCGSGIISIMLSRLLEYSHIKALDISEEALEVAKINAKKYGVNEKIEFIQSDLLSNLEDESIDVLVSNPPYIANDEPLHVGLSYEPDLALFGGSIGDEILQRIIDEFVRRDIKTLACEMGYDQKDKIANYLKQYNLNVEFYQDLAGLDRGFIVKKL